MKLSKTCPFERLEWLFISKIHLFHELEQIKQLKFGVPIIRMFHKLERRFNPKPSCIVQCFQSSATRQSV